ncbi:MAG TPA: hypothetical protein DDZ41_06335, partial [Flavobacterium sp.]|nr:hypothetical protein [Flavobacterium sp.]
EIIDARTSDAIALALRFQAPIFTYKNILDKAGIYLNTKPVNQNIDDINNDGVLSTPETFANEEKKHKTSSLSQFSIKELYEKLEDAVLNEDYEKAARIRDEISKKES